MEVKLQRLHPNAKVPTQGTAGSAGWDLYSVERGMIASEDVLVFSTGWKVEVPEGYYLEIKGRSGLATKGIWAHIGTVDADFRGEMKVVLVNHSDGIYEVKEGDRIAQCILHPVVSTSFKEVSVLSETTRGANGYGSTGR